MGKCLITKLNGTVDNDNILRIGEIRVFNTKLSNPTMNTQFMSLTFSKDTNLEIVGDAYFTDNTLTENRGKKKICLANQLANFHVSNNDCQIAILDKYSLISIIANAHRVGDLEDFRFSKDLSSIIIKDTEQTGDIANLKNLTNLTELSLSNTQVSGNIANLKNLTNLTKLSLSNTQVSGNIANLKNLTNLTELSLSNKTTPLTGNINELNNLTNCNNIVLSYGKFTGDLATLPSACRHVVLEYDKGSVLTWSTRPSSAKIIAISFTGTITNIDKMLQDQAQCQVGFIESDSMWMKLIRIGGTRTSASDAAVATLQQKGYTISIEKA